MVMGRSTKEEKEERMKWKVVGAERGRGGVV